MKKIYKFWGVIAIVAIIGLALAGCDNGTTSGNGNNNNTGSDITGTYSGSTDGANYTVTIASTTWTLSVTGSRNFSDSGIYTRNGNTATLRSSRSNIDVGTATINGNSLTVVLNRNTYYPGTYYATKTGS
ncbi:MAG: hypothetical protein LBP76_04185 [Treponema sp.]|jgi:predicted small secreted protein|nr:hypothetical protein [Treponema sp.]